MSDRVTLAGGHIAIRSDDSLGTYLEVRSDGGVGVDIALTREQQLAIGQMFLESASGGIRSTTGVAPESDLDLAEFKADLEYLRLIEGLGHSTILERRRWLVDKWGDRL